MASNLACVGLAVADGSALGQLIRDVMPSSHTLGTAGDVEIRRWDDESGARLIFGLRHGDVVDFLPSFAAPPAALLSSIDIGEEGVATAAVVNESGEQMTSLAIELEEWRLIRGHVKDGPLATTVVGLGVQVSIFANEEAFESSPSSLLSERDSDQPPPAHYIDRGWKWPPRVGPESFISYGVFGAEEPRKPHARLAGTVLEADVRAVAKTGQSFVRTTVRTVGFEAQVCFPSSDGSVPAVGSVLHGTVYLVGSVAGAAVGPSPPDRRRWFRRPSRS